MASTSTLDLGGNDLVVNSITTGVSKPNTVLSTGLNSLVGGSGAVNVTSITTATAAPTAAQTGATFILNRLAGSTVTLPAPVVGTEYKFVIGTVNTSVAYKIITDASTTFLAGGIYIDKALTITRYDADGTTIRSINLNGTTTGGAAVGDQITVTCISATQWSVSGTVSSSGTLATPFATS